MKRATYLGILVWAAGYSLVFAQPAAREPQGKKTSGSRYFLLQLSNDVYQRTDGYYTGGIRLAFAGPELAKNPLRHLLFSPKRDAVHVHGITLAADVFTPLDISREEVIAGDRPYAGYLYAGSFLVSTQARRRRRITSAIHAGIMGPAARMESAQKDIHRWLHCLPPQGWAHQVRTDTVVEYSVQGEKGLLKTPAWLEVIGQAGFRAGTLYNHVTAGATLRAGKFRGYFEDRPSPRLTTPKFQCYAYGHAQGSWVAYNATLQGGLFNRDSPYTLRPDQISRWLLQRTAGVVVDASFASLEVTQTWLGREFTTGRSHQWNHVTLWLFF